MRTVDRNHIHMAIGVVKTEIPVSASVTDSERKVEPVIKREPIVVQRSLHRRLARIAAYETWRIPHLCQESKTIAGMSCPDGIYCHSITHVPVHKNIYGMAVVEPGRKCVSAVLFGESAVGPCERIRDVTAESAQACSSRTDRRQSSPVLYPKGLRSWFCCSLRNSSFPVQV